MGIGFLVNLSAHACLEVVSFYHDLACVAADGHGKHEYCLYYVTMSAFSSSTSVVKQLHFSDFQAIVLLSSSAAVGNVLRSDINVNVSGLCDCFMSREETTIEPPVEHVDARTGPGSL